MGSGLNEDIRSKNPTLLECYSVMWNPVSPWRPHSELHQLSHEFDFALTKSLNKT